MAIQQCVPHMLMSYATANNMKRLSAAQQCFHAKFVSVATIKYT